MSIQLLIYSGQKHPLVLSLFCSISTFLIANADAAAVLTKWVQLLGASLAAVTSVLFLVRFIVKWYKTGKIEA
jgi:hypothetical protein